MKIEISDSDVTAAIDAYCKSSILGEQPPLVSLAGMKAALARFVELHPEPGGQRAMHELVNDAELDAMMRAIAPGPWAGAWADNVRSAGNGLLAGRAAPRRAHVEIMPGMTKAFLQEVGIAQTEPNVATAGAALHWLADRLNGKHEKPVDPRVAILMDFFDDTGVSCRSDMTSTDRAERLLAKLDEVKP